MITLPGLLINTSGDKNKTNLLHFIFSIVLNPVKMAYSDILQRMFQVPEPVMQDVFRSYLNEYGLTQ